VSNKLIWAMS